MDNIERIIKLIYDFIIEIIAFLGKIGILLILPFKFVQFFIESLREQKQLREARNGTSRDA